MNALEMLKRDHAQVETLFAVFEQGSAEGRVGVIEQVRDLVEQHDQKETVVFYPAIRERMSDPGVQTLLDKFESAHAAVSEAFEALEGIEDKAGVEYLNRGVTLRTMLRSHAEEEENVLFPALRFRFNDDDFNLLGEQMESV